jgi:hypothetical protein
VKPSEYIEYFKSLVECESSAERWESWWDAHGVDMAKLVSRGIYLRLTSPMPHTKYMAVFAALEDAGFSYPRPRDYFHPRFYEPGPIPVSWLQKRIALAEFEETFFRPAFLTQAFAIQENFRQDDEIWTFCSSPETWKRWMGRSGFAFVRDGVPYDHLVTTMN